MMTVMHSVYVVLAFGHASNSSSERASNDGCEIHNNQAREMVFSYHRRVHTIGAMLKLDSQNEVTDTGLSSPPYHRGVEVF